MKVIVFPEPGQEGKWLEPLPNDWHKAHYQLRLELTNREFDVSVWPCEVDKGKDIGLCFDFPRYPCNVPDRSVCVMLEPPVVFPRQYDKINGLPFKRILTFARDFCDNSRVIWEPYPVVKYNGPLDIKRDKYICAITSGGKDFQSVNIHGRVYESYYNSRRLAYLAFGKDMDLYGWNWDVEMQNMTNYKGAIVGHKVQIMSKYQKAVVFENCYCEGYASEKQFDAWQAGVDPLIRGWRPDYPWEYAESHNWAVRVAKAVEGIV